MAEINYRFRLRRRTKASWASLNEVLLDSEIGFESDTKNRKVGDGVTAWNSLRYERPVYGVGVLVDGASIALNAALYDNWRVTLGGNRTLANPTNLIDGQTFNVRILQDATGSRTLAFGTKFKFPNGATPVLSTTAGAKDFLSCQYDATNDTIYAVLNKAFG